MLANPQRLMHLRSLVSGIRDMSLCPAQRKPLVSSEIPPMSPSPLLAVVLTASSTCLERRNPDYSSYACRNKSTECYGVTYQRLVPPHEGAAPGNFTHQPLDRYVRRGRRPASSFVGPSAVVLTGLTGVFKRLTRSLGVPSPLDF
jgi:hypothetical protein